VIAEEEGFRIGFHQSGALLKIHSSHKRVEILMQPREQNSATLNPGVPYDEPSSA
jgi:hypothetical protein